MMDGMMGVFYIPYDLLCEEVRVDSIKPVDSRAVRLMCRGLFHLINCKYPGEK